MFPGFMPTPGQEGRSNREFCGCSYCSIEQTDTNQLKSGKKTILKTSFFGSWSQFIPECICPPPRHGAFYIQSDDENCVYMGYGINSFGDFYNDLWKYDFNTRLWKDIKLSGAVVSPRTGTRGILVGENLVLFGGYAKNHYFTDLHRINVRTGEVVPIETTGPTPFPRSTFMTGYYNRRFYIWGGFNGNWPSELCYLDLNNMTWTIIPQNITGRTGAPFVQIDSKIYIYGSSKASGLCVVDMNKNVVTIEQTTGAEPISSTAAAGMVHGDGFLFFFGGKATNSHMLMYALDLSRMWWFVFHVNPDLNTVAPADGYVNDTGIYMLPRSHGFICMYDKNRRTIVYALGCPEDDPPPINEIYIGDALGIIHQRDDMLEMFHHYL